MPSAQCQWPRCCPAPLPALLPLSTPNIHPRGCHAAQPPALLALSGSCQQPQVHSPAGPALALSAMSSTHTPRHGQLTGTAHPAFAVQHAAASHSRQAAAERLPPCAAASTTGLKHIAPLDQPSLSAPPSTRHHITPSTCAPITCQDLSTAALAASFGTGQLPSHCPATTVGALPSSTMALHPLHEVQVAGQTVHKPQRPGCMPQQLCSSCGAPRSPATQQPRPLPSAAAAACPAPCEGSTRPPSSTSSA